MNLVNLLFFGVLGLITAIIAIILLVEIDNLLHFDRSMDGCSLDKYSNVLALIKKDVINLIWIYGIVISFSALCWYSSIENATFFNHKNDAVIKALNNEIEYDTISLRPDGKLQEIEIKH